MWDDDYHKWFSKNYPNQTQWPKGLTNLGWNSAPWHLEKEAHPTAWNSREAQKYIKEYDFSSKPLFGKISFFKPHGPYDAPQSYIDKIDENKMELQVTHAEHSQKFKDHPDCTEVASCGIKDPIETHNSRRNYLAGLKFVDDEIGNVMKTLESKGQLDNTYILFTADHGDMMADHFLWEKSVSYEGASHIPMMFSGPGIKQKVSDELVELRDIFPTALDTAGGDLTKYNFDGQSLWSVIKGDKWRTHLDFGL